MAALQQQEQQQEQEQEQEGEKARRVMFGLLTLHPMVNYLIRPALAPLCEFVRTCRTCTSPPARVL